MIDKLSGTVDCRYLRPSKAEKMRMLHEQGISKLHNLKIQTIKNGVILPVKRDKKLLFGNGGVVNDLKQYCELSGICGRVWGGYDFEEPDFLDKKVVFCGYAVKHWGHFIIEAVNRLWYYLENDDSSIDYYVFIIDINEEREIKENYLEFLQLLGIDNRIKLINKPTRFREIIIPQNSFVYNKYYSDSYIRIFETVRQNALLKSSVFGGGRLFFSRGNFQKAKETEIGLDMLDNLFQNNGFTVLYPEKLSLKKMICLMNQAEICVFPSGTPSHNSLFVPEKGNIVIIEKQAIINKVQTAIDYIKELSVCYIDGNYSPYPVTAGGGPFFYAYNRHFKKYADDNKLYPPDGCYINEKAKKRNVRHFLSLYHKWFCYGWATEDWQIQFADIIFQAHIDTADEIGEYLNGNTLFSIKQLLDPVVFRRIMKKIVTIGFTRCTYFLKQQ